MKKLIVLMAAIAAGVAAKAEENPYQYLYWQVDESKVDSGIGSYDAAMFYKVDGAGNVELSRVENESGGRWSSVPQMTEFASYGASDSFLFELAKWSNGSWETVGASETFTYSQLASYLTSVKGGSSNIPTQGVLSPSFAAVPEPTSGLLMLLGIAGLALRRKRA